jgi:hypothetical protein
LVTPTMNFAVPSGATVRPIDTTENEGTVLREGQIAATTTAKMPRRINITRRNGRMDLLQRFNDSTHRWRPLRDSRIVGWRPGAAIRWSAGFGRIPVLWLPGRELKDALPRQPRTQSRYQHAGDEHPAHTGRNHNAEASNSHSGYKLLNSGASKHHLSSRYGSLPRPRSLPQHLSNDRGQR